MAVIGSHDLPALQKPFTPTLGLAIAPLHTPYYEGSGGIFLRLSNNKDDNRIGLLTCAHVSHPPPVFQKGGKYSSPRNDVILLGTGAFNTAVHNIILFIRHQLFTIIHREQDLADLPAQEEGEAGKITAKRKQLMRLIKTARAELKEAEELHTYVTKNFTTFESRMLGFALHSAKVEVGADKFLYDWSVIQLDNDKIDLAEFKGNRLFVGASLSLSSLLSLYFSPRLTDPSFLSYTGGTKVPFAWYRYMYPRTKDRPRDPPIDGDMLLPLKGHVTEAEWRNPQDLDTYNKKALLAVKNGRTTGTTFGRVNGLESVIRNGTSQPALQFLVCGYDSEINDPNTQFSDAGDSGSFVVARDGRLIGQLTGGGGPRADRMERSYITPYYALKAALDQKFPGCHLLDVDT